MIKICVVGAGLTGWLTAIAVKRKCPEVAVTIINSRTEPRNVGIGEACPPFFFKWLFDVLEVKPQERDAWATNFFKQTKSTVKNAMHFQNWTAPQDRAYYHPFMFNSDSRSVISRDFIERAETDADTYRLTDIWYELYKQGRKTSSQYSEDMADLYWATAENRFPFYQNKFINLESITCHISSNEMIQFLEDNYSGVLDQVLDITVADIEVNESGTVKSLIDAGGNAHRFDVYIDCTGFKRIFSKHIDFEFAPAPNKILHNAAVIVNKSYQDRAELDRELTGYTAFYGMQSGWLWEIPLMNRKSTGYVFNSNEYDIALAQDELLARTGTDNFLHDPLVVQWQPGWNHLPWNKNVITVGLAAGFIDALDANTIAVQIQQINKIAQSLNNPKNIVAARHEYNTTVNQLYNDTIERQDIHFALAPRNDTAYWQRNKSVFNQKDLLDLVLNVKLKNTKDFSRAPSLYYDAHWLGYFMYYGHDLSLRTHNSSPELLDLAEVYFDNKRKFGQAQARLLPTASEWLEQIGVDIKDCIK